MAQPSPREQLMLELINRARLDPQGDFNAYLTSYSPPASSDPQINGALNFFRVNGAVLLAQINALSPVAPVAWNSALADAATAHSQLMISNNAQEHQLPGEASLGARVTAAGYSFSTVGENIFAFTESILHGHAGFMVDWGNTSTGIQTPPGHRVNILGAAFKEVGLSALTESNPATSVGPLVVTQDFGARLGASGAIILGVAYNDLDGDRFYSEGEGRGGLGLSLTRSGIVTNLQTQSAGGFAQEAAAGNYVMRFTGAGLPVPLEISLAVAQANIKVDVIGADMIAASATFGMLSGVARGQLLGRLDGNITGNALNNILDGNPGANLLDGGAGIDTAIYQGPRSGYAITAPPVIAVIGAPVVREINDLTPGRDGRDTLNNVERVQFTDGVLAFDNLRTDNAGRGYLIYRAAFDRTPDLEGLGYWIRELDRGQDFGAVVAASFIASEEFIRLNGANTSNTQFVNLLYQNVLHRAGEPDGVAYWLSELNAGGARSNMLASFAVSAENVSNVAPFISDGIFFV